MRTSIFENDSTLGDDRPVRLFTFWWDGIGYGGENWFGSLREAHDIFNGAFVQSFPRQLYTNPFTSYNASGIGIGSRLTGTGETLYSDAQLRAWITTAADRAGIGGNVGNLRISSQTIGDLQAGQNLQIPGSSVNPLATTDGANSFLAGLGADMKWPLVAAAAVITLLLIRDR